MVCCLRNHNSVDTFKFNHIKLIYIIKVQIVIQILKFYKYHYLCNFYIIVLLILAIHTNVSIVHVLPKKFYHRQKKTADLMGL